MLGILTYNLVRCGSCAPAITTNRPLATRSDDSENDQMIEKPPAAEAFSFSGTENP